MHSERTLIKHVLMASACLLITATAHGQEKVEREWRIKSREVPRPALEWFKDAYELPKRVKWYREENESGNFFEAKLNWKQHRHSIKFNEQGTVVDVEIEMGLDQLEPEVAKAIVTTLDSMCPGYRILKIQQQWTGAPDDLEDLIDEQERENLHMQYELEVFFRSGKEAGYHELLFSENGQFTSMRPIRMNTADHLQY